MRPFAGPFDLQPTGHPWAPESEKTSAIENAVDSEDERDDESEDTDLHDGDEKVYEEGRKTEEEFETTSDESESTTVDSDDSEFTTPVSNSSDDDSSESGGRKKTKKTFSDYDNGLALAEIGFPRAKIGAGSAASPLIMANAEKIKPRRLIRTCSEPRLLAKGAYWNHESENPYVRLCSKVSHSMMKRMLSNDRSGGDENQTSDNLKQMTLMSSASEKLNLMMMHFHSSQSFRDGQHNNVPPALSATLSPSDHNAKSLLTTDRRAQKILSVFGGGEFVDQFLRENADYTADTSDRFLGSNSNELTSHDESRAIVLPPPPTFEALVRVLIYYARKKKGLSLRERVDNPELFEDPSHIDEVDDLLTGAADIDANATETLFPHVAQLYERLRAKEVILLKNRNGDLTIRTDCVKVFLCETFHGGRWYLGRASDTAGGQKLQDKRLSRGCVFQGRVVQEVAQKRAQQGVQEQKEFKLPQLQELREEGTNVGFYHAFFKKQAQDIENEFRNRSGGDEFHRENIDQHSASDDGAGRNSTRNSLTQIPQQLLNFNIRTGVTSRSKLEDEIKTKFHEFLRNTVDSELRRIYDMCEFHSSELSSAGKQIDLQFSLAKESCTEHVQISRGGGVRVKPSSANNSETFWEQTREAWRKWEGEGTVRGEGKEEDNGEESKTKAAALPSGSSERHARNQTAGSSRDDASGIAVPKVYAEGDQSQVKQLKGSFTELELINVCRTEGSRFCNLPLETRYVMAVYECAIPTGVVKREGVVQKSGHDNGGTALSDGEGFVRYPIENPATENQNNSTLSEPASASIAQTVRPVVFAVNLSKENKQFDGFMWYATGANRFSLRADTDVGPQKPLPSGDLTIPANDAVEQAPSLASPTVSSPTRSSPTTPSRRARPKPNSPQPSQFRRAGAEQPPTIGQAVEGSHNESYDSEVGDSGHVQAKPSTGATETEVPESETKKITTKIYAVDHAQILRNVADMLSMPNVNDLIGFLFSEKYVQDLSECSDAASKSPSPKHLYPHQLSKAVVNSLLHKHRSQHLDTNANVKQWLTAMAVEEHKSPIKRPVSTTSSDAQSPFASWAADAQLAEERGWDSDREESAQTTRSDFALKSSVLRTNLEAAQAVTKKTLLFPPNSLSFGVHVRLLLERKMNDLHRFDRVNEMCMKRVEQKIKQVSESEKVLGGAFGSARSGGEIQKHDGEKEANAETSMIAISPDNKEDTQDDTPLNDYIDDLISGSEVSTATHLLFNAIRDGRLRYYVKRRDVARTGKKFDERLEQVAGGSPGAQKSGKNLKVLGLEDASPHQKKSFMTKLTGSLPFKKTADGKKDDNDAERYNDGKDVPSPLADASAGVAAAPHNGNTGLGEHAAIEALLEATKGEIPDGMIGIGSPKSPKMQELAEGLQKLDAISTSRTQAELEELLHTNLDAYFPQTQDHRHGSEHNFKKEEEVQNKEEDKKEGEGVKNGPNDNSPSASPTKSDAEDVDQCHYDSVDGERGAKAESCGGSQRGAEIEEKSSGKRLKEGSSKMGPPEQKMRKFEENRKTSALQEGAQSPAGAVQRKKKQGEQTTPKERRSTSKERRGTSKDPRRGPGFDHWGKRMPKRSPPAHARGPFMTRGWDSKRLGWAAKLESGSKDLILCRKPESEMRKTTGKPGAKMILLLLQILLEKTRGITRKGNVMEGGNSSWSEIVSCDLALCVQYYHVILTR